MSKIGDRINVHRNTVGDWVKGRMEPDLVNLYKAAAFLKCDPVWLKYGNNPPEDKGDLQNIIITGNDNAVAHNVGAGSANVSLAEKKEPYSAGEPEIKAFFEKYSQLNKEQQALIKGMIEQMIKQKEGK